MAAIDIILATFNGEKYIIQLIESIMSQTYRDFILIVRDDGSTDNTITILKNYANRYQGKIIIIESNHQTYGVCQNFAFLLNLSTADYIMFCDQDDVWLPSKIKDTFETMKKMESQYPNMPVLVHTDLTVVDDQLNIITNSMWTHQNVDLSIEQNVYKIAMHNVVTGCSIMINKLAKQCAMPIPSEALMHDWWIAINTCKYGKICHIPKSTVLYRQHLNNTIGAKQKNILFYMIKLLDIKEFIDHNFKKYKMIKKLRFKLHPLLLIIHECRLIAISLISALNKVQR